jgi:hypothetical protein
MGLRPRGAPTPPPTSEATSIPTAPVPVPVPVPAPAADGVANEIVVRKYDFMAVYPTASEEYSFEELRARALARRAAAAQRTAPGTTGLRTPLAALPLSSLVAPAVAGATATTAVAVHAPPKGDRNADAAATTSAPPPPAAAAVPGPQQMHTPEMPRQPLAPVPVAIAATTTTAAPLARGTGRAVVPSPTINTKFALSEIQGMFERPLPLAGGVDSPAGAPAALRPSPSTGGSDADAAERSASFGSVMRARTTMLAPASVVREAPAPLAIWRDETVSLAAVPGAATGRPSSAPYPTLAATPATAVRPASATPAARALVYEDDSDNDDDDKDTNDGGPSNDENALPDQENRPPVSSASSFLSTLAPPKAAVPAVRASPATALRWLQGSTGPIAQDSIPVSAAARGHDPTALVFDVYEDAVPDTEAKPTALPDDGDAPFIISTAFADRTASVHGLGTCTRLGLT